MVGSPKITQQLLELKSLCSKFNHGQFNILHSMKELYLSDGKGMSNWDVFTHKPFCIFFKLQASSFLSPYIAGSISDGSNDVTVDQYHRYLVMKHTKVQNTKPIVRILNR
ncbi:hypothetical protein CR513_61996, partial [Mucuna pruriens]